MLSPRHIEEKNRPERLVVALDRDMLIGGAGSPKNKLRLNLWGHFAAPGSALLYWRIRPTFVVYLTGKPAVSTL